MLILLILSHALALGLGWWFGLEEKRAFKRLLRDRLYTVDFRSRK